MKQSFRVEIQCSKCRCSVFEAADEAADDPIFKCTHCRQVIGPQSSIQAAIQGKPHTPIRALVVQKFKRIK